MPIICNTSPYMQENCTSVELPKEAQQPTPNAPSMELWIAISLAVFLHAVSAILLTARRRGKRINQRIITSSLIGSLIATLCAAYFTAYDFALRGDSPSSVHQHSQNGRFIPARPHNSATASDSGLSIDGSEVNYD